METAIEVISALLDIYILRTYLIGALAHHKESINKIWFYLGIIITEILLQLHTSFNVNSESVISTVTTNLLSITTTFALCFFFESKIIYNIAAAVIFQILVLFSENICVISSVAMYDTSVLKGYEYEIKMNLMSKIILLILVIVLFLIRNRHEQKPAVYNILLLSTPALSFPALIAAPLSNSYISEHLLFFSIIWIYIAAINIIHSVLVEKLANSYMTQMYASELEKQVNYQKELDKITGEIGDHCPEGKKPALFLHFWDCYTVLAVLLYCSVCISSNVIKKDGVGKQEEQNQTRCGERIPLAGLFLLWRIEVCWYQCDRKACMSAGYSAEKSAVLYGRHMRYQYGIIHT